MARKASVPKKLTVEAVTLGIQRALETAFLWERHRTKLKVDSVMSEFLRWSEAARKTLWDNWLRKQRNERESQRRADLKELAEKYIAPFLKRDLKARRTLAIRRSDLIPTLKDFPRAEEIADDLFAFLEKLRKRTDLRRKPTQPHKIAQLFIKEKYGAPDEKTQRKPAPVKDASPPSPSSSLEFVEFVLKTVWGLENSRSKELAADIFKEAVEVQRSKDMAAEAALRMFRRRQKEKALSSDD